MDDLSQQTLTLSTQDRLLTAGLTLFAGQGFRRTTVGEIEAAAGFTARGGTLYKHFPSKQALLDTAVARHVDRVRALRRTADLLPLGEFRSELTLLMRSLLIELEEERLITLLLEKEGDFLPQLRDRFYESLVEPGYRDAAALLQRAVGAGSTWDVEALSVVVVGALVNAVRNRWTFGATVLDVSDERLVHTLVQLLEVVTSIAGSGASDPLGTARSALPDVEI